MISRIPSSSTFLNPLAHEFESLHIDPTRKTTTEPTSFEQKQEKTESTTPGASMASAPAATASKAVGTAKRVLRITNAHQDDIHGMIAVGPDTLVSGSKDGSLKLWNTKGELVHTVWSPKVINYTGWITALSPFGPKQWMSGTRDGYIDLWHNDGGYAQTLAAPERSTTGFKCKERNTERINCLSQDLAAEKTARYYVGIATQFSIHHMSQHESLTSCTTSKNDWVYCIRPLTDRKVMVVTGPNLDMFTHDPKSNRWGAEELVTETRTRSDQKHPRPYISDVTFLDGKTNMCALSVFGGSVVVFDVEAKTPVRNYKEHEKRVWQIANIRPEIFASCSDDRTIKIWDVRLPRCAQTIRDHIGRVSCLLRMSDVQLVSGSCPDDLRSTKERARLEFWDMRAL